MSIHEPYVIAATAKHTATLIFLHGLGDTGKSWCSSFGPIAQPHIKYIFPNAPTRPVTLNLGMQMPCWFDIYGLSEDSRIDENGVKSSSVVIRKLVEQEITSGIPSHRIMLGGFSQGGSLALYTALTNQNPLAGVIALSSWLVLHKEIEKMAMTSEMMKMPVLQCHGDDDCIVPFASGKGSADILKRKGFQFVSFQTYKDIGHGASEDEIRSVANFINSNLK